MRFAASLGLALPLLAAAAPSGHGSGSCGAPSPRAALYVHSNDPAGADIIAFGIGSDGKLSGGIKTPTGGKGLTSITNPPQGGAIGPSPTDPLFGSHAVVVSGNLLFSVNAGSNEVSLFWIDPNNVLHPKLIGKPVSSGGVFPQHLNYSPELKTACVLNGGTTAGLQCFHVDPRKGLSLAGGLRPIHANNQTNPPVGPVGTASDVVFNPSNTAVFAVLKGNDGMTPGFIYAYEVLKDGSISTEPIISRPVGSNVPFSLEFLGSDSHAIVTDPLFGTATVKVSAGFEVTVDVTQPIVPQAATCWSNYLPKYNTVVITDGGAPNITLIDATTGLLSGTIIRDPSVEAGLDLKDHDDFFYVLDGSNSISVYDISPLATGAIPTLAQLYDVSFLGPRPLLTGAAIYPA